MRSDDNKKNNHYGVLCGLRASALGDSDTDSSRSSTPEPPPKDDLHKHPPATPVNQRRPVSLTLPFENRDRESHLVSEEDFDRIVRQAELDDVVPSIPTPHARNMSVSGLRRSISTARNTTLLRQRPVSLDVGSMVALSAQTRDKGRPVSFSRDSTLTALPRPPTTNQMAVYPGQAVPSTPIQQQGSPPSTRKRHMQSSTTVNDADDTNVFREFFQQGHKRSRSAAQMVESVKKRLKRSVESLGSDADPTDGSPSKLSLGSPHQHLSSYAASVQYQYGRTLGDTSIVPDASADAFVKVTKPPITTASNLKKSLLTRTWSRARQHAKKLSVSVTASDDSSPSISDPISLQSRPETARSLRSETSTAASTGTSQYYASAEPSPRNTYESSRADTLDSDRKDSFEYISGPLPKKNILTRMGAPPRRSELNTVVSRQQSRIVDLTLLNNVLVQQVETLRGEVEGMQVVSQRNKYTAHNGSPVPMRRYQMSDSDSGYSINGNSGYDSEQENYGKSRAGRKRKSDGATSAWSSSVSARRSISSGRVQRDPEGWKHIMGVGAADDGERMDVDDLDDDKRKTWMTCDSES